MAQPSGVGQNDPSGPATPGSSLTLTGLLLAFTIWMGIGWLVAGPIGLCVGAALVVMWYGVAIWRAAHPPPHEPH